MDMEIITSFSKKELEQLITDSVTKCLTDKLSPQPESSDRIGIDEACVILGTPDRPASKATVYKMTHLKKLPFMKFGARCIFSRRLLTQWVEQNTKLPPDSRAEISLSLAATAEKHLERNGK